VAIDQQKIRDNQQNQAEQEEKRRHQKMKRLPPKRFSPNLDIARFLIL